MLGRVGGCPVLIVLQMVCLPPFETVAPLERKGDLLRCQELLRASQHHNSDSYRFLEGWLQPLALSLVLGVGFC